MKISDLPPGLKELAELRKKEHIKEHGMRETHIDVLTAIIWQFTPEGYAFWREVNERNFSVYYNCKVVNFKPKVQNLKHA